MNAWLPLWNPSRRSIETWRSRMRQKKGTEGCGSGKSLLSQQKIKSRKFMMKFTSKNSWEMRLNCGRRMEFQPEFLILSGVYFLPTKTSVKHWWITVKHWKKTSRNYGNEVTTAASSCVPCWGTPGFVQLNVVSCLKMGVVPIFLGSPKFEGNASPWSPWKTCRFLG